MRDEPLAARWSKFRVGLDIAASVAMIATALFFFWGASKKSEKTSGRPVLPVPKAPVPLAGAAIRGNPTAPFALLTFADFECPFCSRFTKEVLPILEQKYIASGELKFVFRNLPLPIHQHARRAAQAAECAGRQNRFWAMHDRLFLHSSNLADSELRQYAIDGGVDAMAFDSCLVNDATVSRRLDDDRELARSLGIVSTPSFFLGHVEPNGDLKVATVIAGARPVDYFIATVDKVIRVR